MIQKPKGTKDLLPDESYKWQEVERKIKEYQYLNIQNYFKEELGKQQMLFKKKCILLKIKVEGVLH